MSDLPDRHADPYVRIEYWETRTEQAEAEVERLRQQNRKWKAKAFDLLAALTDAAIDLDEAGSQAAASCAHRAVQTAALGETEAE